MYLPLAHTKYLRGHNSKFISTNDSLLNNMLFLKKKHNPLEKKNYVCAIGTYII